MRARFQILLLTTALCAAILGFAQQPPSLTSQTGEEAAQKSSGCISAGCHVNSEPMHVSEAVRLGCTDCHGGNAETKDKLKAHVSASDRDVFRTSANPIRAYTSWLRESTEYVRFVNPGDFRAVDQT